jgi:hypothetical protein
MGPGLSANLAAPKVVQHMNLALLAEMPGWSDRVEGDNLDRGGFPGFVPRFPDTRQCFR